MSISDLTSRLLAAQSEIAREKGELRLFALFLREDAPDKWDLIVSAPWAKTDQQEVLKFLQRVLLRHLGTEGLLKISRIILSDPDSPQVQAINRAWNVQVGSVFTVKDSTLFDMPIKEAVILTSSAG